MKVECWSGQCRADASASRLGVRDSYGTWHPFCEHCVYLARVITHTPLEEK